MIIIIGKNKNEKHHINEDTKTTLYYHKKQ